MSGCACSTNKTFDGMSKQYIKILWIIIFINASMFVIEIYAGAYAQSQALFADALDFLGDAVTYTISLIAIGYSLSVRSKVALFKGITLAIMGLWVLISSVYRIFYLQTPDVFIMGSIGLLAFAANMFSVLILLKYKEGDANVRSVWLCSRNDAIGNLMIIVAASGVWVSSSGLPDVIIAIVMASLFLSSAYQIIKLSLAEMKQEK